MESNNLCRTCLSTESLYPIFQLRNESVRYSKAIFLTTGVKVNKNDGLPQKMCKECVDFVNYALEFRKKCRKNEQKLLVKKLNLLEVQDNISIKEDTNEVQFELTTKNGLKSPDLLRNDSEIIKHKDVKSATTCLFENNPDMKTERNNLDYLEDSKDSLKDVNLDNYLIENSCVIPSKFVDDSDLQETKSDNSDKDEMFTFDDDFASDSYNDTYDVKSDLILTSYAQNLPTEFVRKKSKKSKRDKHKDSKKRKKLETKKYKTHTSDRLDYKHVVTENLSITLPFRIKKEKVNRKIRVVKRPFKLRPCKICGKEILGLVNMKEHIQSEHAEHKFRCERCGAQFRSEYRLCSHLINEHHDPEALEKRKTLEEVEECNVCQKVFQKRNLKHHYRTQHAGMKPVCEHCGKNYANSRLLMIHCRAQHGYEKTDKCSFCEFTACSAEQVKVHERLHTGEKPFVCEQCGVKFHARYLLSQHRLCHVTEKTVQCDLCPAKFKARKFMMMHKNDCHKGCSYKCYMCSNIFTSRKYIVKHLRHVHGVRGKIGTIERVDGTVMAAPDDK